MLVPRPNVRPSRYFNVVTAGNWVSSLKKLIKKQNNTNHKAYQRRENFVIVDLSGILTCVITVYVDPSGILTFYTQDI